MSEHDELSTGNDPEGFAARLDEIADRFDAAWRDGHAPRLEDYLLHVEERRRPALLRELVQIDLEYRWKAGQPSSLEEYARNYPELCEPDGTLPEELIAYAGQFEARFGSTVEAVERLATAWLHPTEPTAMQSLQCPRCEAPVPARAGQPQEHPTLPPYDSDPGVSSSQAACGKCGMPLSPEAAAAPALPRMIGRYQILRELGRGGSSVVYEASDAALGGRCVALKMIQGGIFAGPSGLARFHKEARVAAQLRHLHIVPVYEVGEAEGVPYYVMELMMGGSLQDRLRSSPLPAHEAARLLIPLAHAVQYAHNKQILHRDLKPANVLLAEDGRPLLTDFGLARVIPDESELTVTGAVMGTPAYMAPEQASGDTGSIGTAVDIYGLGAILFAMLTGGPPFKGANREETLEQVKKVEPSLSAFPSGVPRDLVTICAKCLSKQPARRYATADKLADDLERFLRGKPITARRVPLVERVWKWCRRNPVLLRATILTIGITGVSFFIFSLIAYQTPKLEDSFQSNWADVGKLDLRDEQLEHLKALRFYKLRVQSVDEALSERRFDDAAELLRQFEGRDAWWELRRLRYEVSLRGQSPPVLAMATRGTKPLLLFDQESPTVLWVGDGEGKLSLFEVRERRSLTSVVAHGGGISGLSWVGTKGILVTAGRDGKLKFWARTGDQIASAAPDVQRGRPLLDVAASHDGRWIACLDNLGEFAVMDGATREWVFQAPLEPGNREVMARGRLAYNCDDRFLAVSGFGRKGAVFVAAPPLRQLLELNPYPGSTVTAQLWHPTNPNILLLADNWARYQLYQLDEATPPSRFRLTFPKQPCAALAVTRDGSRWFCVDQTGRLVVYDPKYLGEVIWRQGPNGLAYSMTISADGSRVAVAYEDGTLALWETD